MCKEERLRLRKRITSQNFHSSSLPRLRSTYGSRVSGLASGTLGNSVTGQNYAFIFHSVLIYLLKDLVKFLTTDLLIRLYLKDVNNPDDVNIQAHLDFLI